MSQPLLDGMPNVPNVHAGWLYVCVNDAGVVKVGISSTARTLGNRMRAHVKEARMREVFTKYLPDVAQEEAALKEVLRDYRITGTEWFDLRDLYIAATLVHFLEERGGHTRRLRRFIDERVASDPRFHQ